MKRVQLFRLVSQFIFIVLSIMGFFFNFPVTLLIITVIAAIFGPFYCGWVCPFGTIQDLVSKLGRKLKIKKFKIPKAVHFYLKFIRYILLALFLFVTADFVFEIFALDARENLNMILLGRFYLGVSTFVLISFVLISLFFERPFCNYFCVEGAKQGVLSYFKLFSIKRDIDKCINCKKCDKVCPMNLPVSDFSTSGNTSCVNCMECISACPVDDTLKYSKVRSIMSVRNLFLVAFVVLAFNLVAQDNSTYNDSIQLADYSNIEYTDGTYTGFGRGFRGNIEVEVVVENNQISDISIVNEREDRRWFRRALLVVNKILNAQSSEVDTISGATFSSRGIIDGVADALSNAK